MHKANQNNQIRERVIYILLSPNDQKFLVGHCLKESLSETYRHNLKGRRDASKEFILELYPERPCLFILEEIKGTVYEATNLLLVWMKIFIEKGYQNYNREILKEMTDNLYFDTKKQYEIRKLIDLKELIECSKCKMPKYKGSICANFLNE